ncbi:MAG: response regulator [Thermodesulfovibrionales bacterium]|nr:response regulator [Thermodesulfovibrionales bacterium]
MAKVLLADDSATMQKVVDVVLREEGFDVQSASTGEEALQAMGTFAPDLVLAYIKLPGMNGYDLTKQIKSSSNITVVLLAGAFEPVDDALKEACGADDTLVKPFQTEDLLACIRKFLPDVGAPAAEGAVEDDDIVFDMSGGEEEPMEAEAVEADVEPEVVTAESAGDPFGGGFDAAPAAEAEVVEAEVYEAEVYEAEPMEVEAEPVEVEAEVYEAEVVEAEVAEPAVAPVVAAAAPAAPAAMPQPQVQIDMPSSDELSAIFMRTVEEKVIEALKGADVRDAIITLLEPRLNDTLNDMLTDVMPELIQKLLKEMVEGSLSMLNRELENIMWETVPELAETLIKKEIEKIKAES